MLREKLTEVVIKKFEESEGWGRFLCELHFAGQSLVDALRLTVSVHTDRTQAHVGQEYSQLHPGANW